MKLYNDFNMYYVDAFDENYDINTEEMVFLLGGLGYDEFETISPTETIKNKLLDKKLIIEDKSQLYEVIFSEEGKKLALSFYNRLISFPKRFYIREFILRGRRKHELTVGRLSNLSGVNYNRIQSMENYRGKGYIHINDLKDVFKIIAPKVTFNTIIKNLKRYEILRKKELNKKKEQEKLNVEKIKKIEQKEQTLKPEEEINFLKFKNKLLKIESPIEYNLVNELIKFDEQAIFDMDTQINYSINGRNYRAEIILTYINKLNNLSKILVECDGYEYHNSKEQLQKDKQRDRDFLSIGIPTIRFTGSEIHKDARSCAEEVFNTYENYAKSVS